MSWEDLRVWIYTIFITALLFPSSINAMQAHIMNNSSNTKQEHRNYEMNMGQSTPRHGGVKRTCDDARAAGVSYLDLRPRRPPSRGCNGGRRSRPSLNLSASWDSFLAFL
jgi:hypothetical protein